MALTRLNNRSVSAVTALPSGISYPDSSITLNDIGFGYKLNQMIQCTNISTGYASGLGNWITIGSIDITPVSTSSIILLMANTQINNAVSGSLNTSFWLNDSAELMRYGEINIAGRLSASGHRWHTPNTTSSVTYKIKWVKESGDSASNGTINGVNGNAFMLYEYVPA